MKQQDLNPFIRHCQIHPNPFLYPDMVMAYDCRIFYVLQGSGTFFVKNQTYHFGQYSLFYVPSGTPYRFSYDANSYVEFLILNFDHTSEHANIASWIPTNDATSFHRDRLHTVPDVFPCKDMIHMESYENAKKDLLNISKYFVNKPIYYAEISSGILKKVFLKIASKQSFKKETSASQVAKQVLTYIGKHYAKPITNQMIADEFGFHPYYLNRLVKTEIGKSLHQCLIEHRAEEAKNLLATSSFSIQQIADATGFGTPSQFSMTFKKMTGVSPSEYREAARTYL